MSRVTATGGYRLANTHAPPYWKPGSSRDEALAAVKYDAEVGFAAEPWRTFALLAAIESKRQAHESSARARAHAIDTYSSFRRSGGESLVPALARFCERIANSTEEASLRALAADLSSASKGDDEPLEISQARPLLLRLLAGDRAILHGGAPELDYRVVAELLLLVDLIA